MKAILSSVFFLCVFSFVASAQLPPPYNSPNDGRIWNMDSLVANSNGAVISPSPNVYNIVSPQVIIRPNDFIFQTENAIIRINNIWDIKGGCTMDAPDSIVIKSLFGINPNQEGRLFGYQATPQGFSKFYTFKNVRFTKLDRIEIMGSDFNLSFDSCEFKDNGLQANITQLLSIRGKEVNVKNCLFANNGRSALRASAFNRLSITGNSILAQRVPFGNFGPGPAQIEIYASGPISPDSVFIANNILNAQSFFNSAINFQAPVSDRIVIINNIIKNNASGIILGQRPNSDNLIANNIIENSSLTNLSPNQTAAISHYSGGIPAGAITKIRNNTFINNRTSIITYGGSNPQLQLIHLDVGTLQDGGGNTFDNSGLTVPTYYIYNQSNERVLAYGNNWGTTNIALIEQRLYDSLDQSNSGRVLYDLTAVGIGEKLEVKELGMSLYPNPATDRVRVQLEDGFNGRSASLVLTDLSGKVLMQEEISGLGTELSIGHLPKGLYLVQLRAGDRVAVRKLVKD